MSFEKNELDLIYQFIDYADGLSIDGKEITCFEDIYSLATEEIETISKNKVTDYIEQVNLFKESFEVFGCEDCSFFDKIILFLENQK